MNKNMAVKVTKLHKKFWYFKKDMKAIHWLFNKNAYDAEFHVLKGIEFEIGHGEAVGILGRNGAGKSTLLKLISGIYHPSYGEIETNGVISSLLELGAGFNAQLTGRENIYLKGTLLGYSTQEVDGMIDDIVSFADIGEYMDLPLDSYSSGMKARLGFALAVYVDPDILIIDEVFAVGDRNFQQKSRAKTIEFFEQGKTILFVSHSEELIRQFCNRVIYLRDGHIAFDGDVEAGIAMYQEDVRKDSFIPRFFAQSIELNNGMLEIDVEYGLGFNKTIHETLDIGKDIEVVAEKTSDKLTLNFVHLPYEIKITDITENRLKFIIDPSIIDGEFNIRVKLHDTKFKDYIYIYGLDGMFSEKKIHNIGENKFISNSKQILVISPGEGNE